MSGKLQVSHQGHDESDKDCDVPTNKHEHSGNDLESDIPSTKQQQNRSEIDEITITESRAQDTSSEIIRMIDTYDRPAKTKAEGFYANQGSYVSSYENKPGKRIPKAGYIAEAGYGRACAEYSVFEGEARGPNAGVKAEASVIKVGAMARAEVFGAEGKAGPAALKLGLGFDTGASAGLDGVEVKLLGTGFTIGPKTSVSVLGSEASVSCSVM